MDQIRPSFRGCSPTNSSAANKLNIYLFNWLSRSLSRASPRNFKVSDNLRLAALPNCALRG